MLADDARVCTPVIDLVGTVFTGVEIGIRSAYQVKVTPAGTTILVIGITNVVDQSGALVVIPQSVVLSSRGVVLHKSIS
jgi:hypothetical protein